MTDSSYDSQENELENDDLSPPVSVIQRPTAQPDSRSRDSVITLSDCDLDQTDTDPEMPLPTNFLYSSTPPSQEPQVSQPSSSQTQCPSKVPVPLPSSCRYRRCSEPSIRNSTSSLRQCLEPQTDHKGTYDDAVDDTGNSEANEVFTKHLSILRLDKPATLLCEDDTPDRSARGDTKRRKDVTKKPPPLYLETSCSSLYSSTTSPTQSSMSSLDSAFSQHSADYTTSCPPLTGTLRMSGNISPCSVEHLSPCSPTQMSFFSSGPLIPSPRESSPKEPLDWGHRKSSHGLHPNSWLKRDRRLSLSRQLEGMEDIDLQDSPLDSFAKVNQGREKRDQESAGSGLRRRSISSLPAYQQTLPQAQHSRIMLGSPSDMPLTVRELRELHQQARSLPKASSSFALPPADPSRRPAQKNQVSEADLPNTMFYIKNARNQPLQRHKSHLLIPTMEKALLPNPARRASEPIAASLGLDQESTRGLERLHRHALRQATEQGGMSQSHGLRISDVETSSEYTEPRFCLSPAATKAVRDYFSLHTHEDPHSSIKKSQEVALAIVQGKREWGRRCSDPRLEDFDQLLFAEESYV